ncbi:MAG: winged helix-turn-helix domain-containing protein [Chitinophagaceae bacterium]
MKKRWFYWMVPAVVLVLIGFKARSVNDWSLGQAKEHTRMRNIGHLVLLSSGDALSRVLPVQEVSPGSYLLRFEKPFMPVPDSIVKILTGQLGRQRDYSLELRQASTQEVMYSFVISEDSAQTIIPCLDRPLPEGQYELRVQFPVQKSTGRYLIAAGILFVLLTGGWLYFRRKPSLPSPAPPDEENEQPFLSLGRYRFYTVQQRLELDGVETELTGKESHLLSILAESPNTIVERSRLQKEVWEDKGVIVTRSLDIFISKLRKKLQADPNIKIVNVHGRGYKLEIG